LPTNLKDLREAVVFSPKKNRAIAIKDFLKTMLFKNISKKS